MGFQKGKLWNGNRFGAPRKNKSPGSVVSLRDSFTKGLYVDGTEDLFKVRRVAIRHALDETLPYEERENTIKMLLDHLKMFVTKPSNEPSLEEESEQVSEVKNFLSDFSPDTLQRMQADRLAAAERRANNNGEEVKEDQK